MRAHSVKIAGVAVAVALLLFYLPAAWAEFTVHGTLGFRASSDGTVSAVQAGGPAERAGLRTGDRIDWGTVRWTQRMPIATAHVPPGRTERLRVLRRGTAREVSMTAVPEARASALDAWLQAGSYAATAVALLVAAAMILLRPGAMSVWLLLYAAGTIGATELNASYEWLPDGVYGPLAIAVSALISGASAYPLLPFVLRFPYDRADGARGVLYRASVGLAVAAVAFFFWYYIRLALGGNALPYGTMTLLQNLPIPFAIGALLFNYIRANDHERQRLKWAIFGMSFAFAAYAASSYAFQLNESLSNALELLTVMMPVSLAYAVLRHRIVDFGFALNRAIVYSATTTSIVVAVTAIDRLSGWALGHFHLALAFDALATIGLGFLMGRIHRVLEGAVDGVLFRKRSRAERHLRRIAAAMPYASTPHAVDEMLAQEPAETLQLATSAVFRYERSVQRFLRMASVKWRDEDAWYIDVDDPMVLLLQNEQAVIKLDDVRWKHAGVPQGGGAPIVAVPIRFRRDLTGFALFSGHLNATTLDPDEVALLAALADSAGSSYGLAEAALSQRRVAELEAQVAGLTRAPT